MFVWRTALSYIVRRTLLVRCTTWQPIKLGSGRIARDRADPSSTAGDLITQMVVDKVTEKMNAQAEKVQAKAEKHAEKINRLAVAYDALDLWTRTEPGARRTRFTREDITAAAVRIADTEGINALSMRRLAAELEAGTMTLYHYVRTKEELLALVSDSIMGELLLPRRPAARPIGAPP